MEEDSLRNLRESAVQLIQCCEDTDLLDLLIKIMLESGVRIDA